jgi:hypothetical protein
MVAADSLPVKKRPCSCEPRSIHVEGKFNRKRLCGFPLRRGIILSCARLTFNGSNGLRRFERRGFLEPPAKILFRALAGVSLFVFENLARGWNRFSHPR